MELGKKIKVLRAQKGISQQELAEKINKTRALISHIELSSKVNYYTLNEIANALDVPVEFFDDQTEIHQNLNEGQGTYEKLSGRIELLEKEIELLKEIIQHQKELIQHLKKNK